MASLRKQIDQLPEFTGEEDDAAYDRVMTDRITALTGKWIHSVLEPE